MPFVRIALVLLVLSYFTSLGWLYLNYYDPLLVKLAALKSENENLKLQVADATAKVGDLTARVAQLSQQNAPAGAKAEPKQLPPSETFIAIDPPEPLGTVTLLNGDAFTDCKLTRIEPDGLKITHSRGVAKLLFVELGPEWQKKYPYDPAKAAIK